MKTTSLLQGITSVKTHVLAWSVALGAVALGGSLLLAPALAQRRGGAPHGGGHPAYHPPVHEVPRGSVHFAPHVEYHAPPRADFRGGRPAEFHDYGHAPYYGSVHFEHHDDWWRRGWWGGVPRYAPDYFRRFRPGWATLLLGGALYYYWTALPDAGCGTQVINDQTYYICDGIYYVPYFYNGTMVYVAVPPPT